VRRPLGIRTLATLGLALFGPVSLFSGLVTLATIPRGVPPAIAGIFVVALSATAVSAALYLIDDIRRR
jgi:hypothetical protein